jgi:tetratricopeptide (TPR) repeat protein
MRSRLFLAILLLSMASPAPAIDLAPLWDFKDPAGSELRFRAALATAQGDDALILQTQIARSFGLRRDFDQARAVLTAIQPQLATAGAEARVRHALEWGRSWSSATHPPATQTDDARAQARHAYESALAIAREGHLDGLAIDALHMLAFVDTAPADQLKWAQAALAVVDASTQPAAKRWEASLRNNLGYALHQLGRLDEALTQFRRALTLREQQGDAGSVRVARWMIAWTLRGLKRDDEALSMQLQLEVDGDAAGQPDPYVYEELETLYGARGDEARAALYAGKRRALKP